MMRCLRKQTLTICFGGTGFILLYWYFNVYLNDLPQTPKTRLTPHLFQTDRGIIPPSTLEDVTGVHYRPDPRDRGTQFTDRPTAGKTLPRSQRNFIAVEGRVKEYCNPPSEDLWRSEEGNVGEEFQLRSVHIIIRHGDRSPIHSIINHPNSKLSCKFDSGFLEKNQKLTSYLNNLQKTETNFHPQSDFRNWELYPNKNICDGAQLTPIGAHQHLNIGEFLQEKYFTKLFKDSFSYEDIHIRSTEYSRTFQSAIAFLYGFLPDFDLQKIQVHLSPDLLFCSPEITGLTCRCPLAQIFKLQSNGMAGSHNRNDTGHRLLVRQLADIYDIKPHQVPWLAAVLDIVMTQVCHQVELPCNRRNAACINKKLIDKVWETVDLDGVKFKTQNEPYLKFAHLSLHPLLSEIFIRMKNTVLLKISPKFFLYSGHDISLTPLLSIFGFHSDGKWPPYASRFVFELYTKRVNTNPAQGFFRVLYNGKDRTNELMFCRKLHRGLCHLHHLKYFLDNHLKWYNIVDFNTQCLNTTE
ncbi:2-phosphoxylose phosphatase 1-like [Argopecten irradians]|uniref:2-phosphoxylose phosphatase 1-like n=1 Tax=Argopecten irradians TaxID=31199 RepID=UPI003723D808